MHDVERGAQEEELKQRYGGLLPKARLLANRGSQHFDSADWALFKCGLPAGSPNGQYEALPPMRGRPAAAVRLQQPSRLQAASS